MAIVPFQSLYPDLAQSETRSATVPGDAKLPGDEYTFIENYCDDPNCDCRRTIINVISRNTHGGKILATISYGWEPERYYAKWSRDKKSAKIMTGVSLDPLNPQSRFSSELLRLFEWMLLDEDYNERIKRHYRLVKERVAHHKVGSQGFLKLIKKLRQMKVNSPFKIGESVRVKTGIKDPDNPEQDIGGWQGRVTEVLDDGIVMIAWDSITLQSLPAESIARCEREGFDWTTMGLDADDYEPAKPRDTQTDVARIAKQLGSAHRWDHLDEEAEIIKAVLGHLDPEEADEMDEFEAWNDYLQARLTWPFEAKVSEFQERGPLQTGNIINVQSIASVEDLYGIIVNLSRKGRRLAFPLCDLEATDTKSKNHELLRAYVVWFANR